MVHTTQQTFRQLLDALSRPGEGQTWSGDILDIARTLLDREVTFCPIGWEPQQVERIVFETMTRTAPAAQADYVFVAANVGIEQLEEVIRAVRVGDLIDPQQSATIIVEHTSGTPVTLTGPGIATTHQATLPRDMLVLRQQYQALYPLGVDYFFVCDTTCVGIPRTTQWKETN